MMYFTSTVVFVELSTRPSDLFLRRKRLWTGAGYCLALSSHRISRTGLQANDIFAGVTLGNTNSSAVLERAGFTISQRFKNYTRYHLSLDRESRC
jgi:hypothetical protein